MNQLDIKLNNDKAIFAPGDKIKGWFTWQLKKAPENIQARLYWMTQGKGTQDISAVETLTFDNPGTSGKSDFIFKLPHGPFSFSGKLISIIWGIELTLPKGDLAEKKEIIVSPSGKELTVGQITPELPELFAENPLKGLFDKFKKNKSS